MVDRTSEDKAATGRRRSPSKPSTDGVERCRKCNVELIRFKNWYESYAEIRNRLCKDCSRKACKEWYDRTSDRRDRARQSGTEESGFVVSGLTTEELVDLEIRENALTMEREWKRNSIPFCRVCGVELIVPETWSHRRRTYNDRICKNCRRVQRRKARKDRPRTSYPDRYCKTCGKLLRYRTRMDDSFSEREKSNAVQEWCRKECFDCRNIRSNIRHCEMVLRPESKLSLYYVSNETDIEVMGQSLQQLETALAERIAGRDSREAAARMKSAADRMDASSLEEDFVAAGGKLPVRPSHNDRDRDREDDIPESEPSQPDGADGSEDEDDPDPDRDRDGAILDPATVARDEASLDDLDDDDFFREEPVVDLDS